MMRKIKFRAWTGHAMDYDVVVGRFGSFYVNAGKDDDGLDVADKGSLTTFNTIYPENTPIMQFTGLKDKNGKEIYEGDIVARLETDWPSQTPDENGIYPLSLDEYMRSISKICKVIFHDAEFCCLEPNGDYKGADALYCLNTGRHGQIEIIGNIHEHPDLIRKEK